MNRKNKVTSLTAAALAVSILAGANLNNEVKADVKPSVNAKQATSAKDAAQANVDNAQKAVNSAQDDLKQAKGQLDSATSSSEAASQNYNQKVDQAQSA